LLADSGWLPEPLRLADPDDDQTGEASTESDTGEDTALPDFLADDEDEAPDDEGEEPTSIAAE
jgi:ParB family chromosome partitioning protein